MMVGKQCSGCFVPFVKEHGHPVFCGYCWNQEAKGQAHRIRGILPTEIAGCKQTQYGTVK